MQVLQRVIPWILFDKIGQLRASLKCESLYVCFIYLLYFFDWY